MNGDVFIDAKGLSCPMPVVKAKKGMDTLESGQVLEIHTTDKGSKSDLTAWASSAGHELLSVDEVEDTFKFFIKKA
ncbi:MAG TPA: sulfurtransferase TusA family protein [Massilibacterium sp.]|nr:sulfurtransferase TusA family protein [Massilibacterium sp.]